MKTLMVSISGIRGIFGAGLDAAVLVDFTMAYGTWARREAEKAGRAPLIVVGRDARVTGDVCARLVMATLQSVGCDVVDAGLATTPTVEMAVLFEKAQGGIILSASHNPAEWNALKLLNEKGEFLTPDEAQTVIDLSKSGGSVTASFDALGSFKQHEYLDQHIQAILDLPFIDREKIAAQDFRVAVDGINSVGGVAIPALLRALGIPDERIHCLNCEPTGRFAHNPEPLPAHLTGILDEVKTSGANLGIVVDPDADRLALVENEGRYLSEELTQVVAADFLWGVRKGAFVTNLSSSRAIEDVAKKHGADVYRSAVGEANVVGKMKEVGATLGGEGNGGVILPDLHHGRDALVGVAMVLQHMANTGQSLSEIREGLPQYAISKNKVSVEGLDVDALLERLATRYANARVSTLDGVKVDLDEGWVHLRKSNTEPIVRIYAEAATPEAAGALAERFKGEFIG